MGVSISLTAGLRGSLLSLTDIDNTISRTQARLSSGKKVASALDNPTNYFASVANLQKAADLDSLKDGIQEATQVIRAADAGMTAMTNVLRQASATAENAITAKSRGQLSLILDQFNSMRKQVDELSGDSGYAGINLLRRQDLSINLGDGTTLTVPGADASSSGFDNMTDGLKVVAPGMNIFNIADSHTVLTSAGAVKEDGALTVTNNDTQKIDGWLGITGINVQTIKSVDLALSATSSGGTNLPSQILDNVGVAAYGSAGFTISRDTSAAISGVPGPGTATAQINNLADVSGYLGPLSGAGSTTVTLTKMPAITSATVVRGSTGAVAGTSLSDPAAVSGFLDSQSANPALSFTYHASSHSWSSSNQGITLIQDPASPDYLGVAIKGSSTVSSAIDIALSGTWKDNDQIQVGLAGYTSSDPAVKVIGYGGDGLSFSLNSSQRSDIRVNLAVPESSIAFGTSMDLTVSASGWKSSDPGVTLSDSGGTVAADLNGGGADLQLELPGGASLSTDSVYVTTTGAFVSSDSSVRLKYDAGSGNLGLYLGGGGGKPALTINLADSWAAGQLSSSPLGNGDTIKLTVDGRHRWLLSDGKTPNAGGIRLSMSETGDAINTLRLNSAQNASLTSVLTVRNDFIDSMAGILSEGADKLTLADLDQEGANMLMLQTRQKLALQSLSLFGEASRSVLKMFNA